MSHLRSLQTLLRNNKKIRQRKLDRLRVLIQAIDQFNIDKKLDPLVDQLVLTFEAWYEEEEDDVIPTLEELAEDKKLRVRFKQKIEEFMLDLEESSVRPFWRNRIKMILELLLLPTQPSLWSRVKSFFTRS